MRRPAPRLLAVAAIAAVAAVALTGCTPPPYQYVASANRDIVFRIPRNWSPVSTADVLAAQGTDPAAASTGWRVYYDAAPHPSSDHVGSIGLDEPILMARTYPVAEKDRGQVTPATLRDLEYPLSTAAQQSEAAARTARGLPPLTLQPYVDEAVTTDTAQGVHDIFTISAALPLSVPGSVTVPTPAPSGQASPAPSNQASPLPAPTSSPAAKRTAAPAVSRAEPATTPGTAGGPAAFQLTGVYDQVALVNAQQTRIHVVVVYCSVACFLSHQQQIDDVVASFTVKKKS